MTKEDILFCLPNGWQNLVSKLYDDLVKLGWNPETDFQQAKQKFKELRFYIKGTKEMNELCNIAESKSKVICIECGIPAGFKTLGGHSFLTCLCDECALLFNARLNDHAEKWHTETGVWLNSLEWTSVPDCEHGRNAKEICRQCNDRDFGELDL